MQINFYQPLKRETCQYTGRRVKLSLMRRKNYKNGYVLLALLIGIAILALLYMIDLRAMLGQAGRIDRYAERPWFEEKRLLDADKFPVKQTGKKGKAVIAEQTKLNGVVRHESENRGELEITIDPNGKAYGRWNCQYQYTDSSYTITADFAGNIDPTKIYEDKNGTNKQLLYFITKGKYRQIKTDKATNNQWPTEETIYVVGWIHPVRDKASLTPDGRQRQPVSNGIQKDYSAKGKLFLMTDSDPENHGNAEYDWQTGEGEPKNADKN